MNLLTLRKGNANLWIIWKLGHLPDSTCVARKKGKVLITPVSVTKAREPLSSQTL